MEFLAWNYMDLFAVDVGVVRYAAVLGAWSGPNVGIILSTAASGPAGARARWLSKLPVAAERTF
jgi:hypothetical protein